MFIHNFKYTLKVITKSKMLIFWTFAFPFILGILFNMAFKDIEKNEKLKIIDLAIVDNDYFSNNKLLSETFKSLSDDKSEKRLFNTKYVDKESAIKLLKEKKVSGYIEFLDNNQNIVVNQSDINSTIIKYTVDEVISMNMIITNMKNQGYNLNELYRNIYDKVNAQNSHIKDISNNNLSYTMIEFYTLIAMACLYCGTIGMYAINNNLANMSTCGKRIETSPISKRRLILSSLVTSYLIQVIAVSLLILFLYFVLKVDFGSNWLLVILLSWIGSLAGLSIGIFICILLKTSEDTKIGIIIAFTMLCCFLSGMMGITMKYVVDKNVPIINMINPASMITDGFYSLYYYSTLNRYFINVVSLLIFSFILILLSYIKLRRQKYDNI